MSNVSFLFKSLNYFLLINKLRTMIFLNMKISDNKKYIVEIIIEKQMIKI